MQTIQLRCQDLSGTLSVEVPAKNCHVHPHQWRFGHIIVLEQVTIDSQVTKRPRCCAAVVGSTQSRL